MKPFISHDGADANGVRAEVSVQVGEGTITKIEGLDGTGRNVQVVMKSSHEAVRKPIAGWLQRTDPLLAAVQEAFDAGATVNYRVESQRKATIDRTLPLGPMRATTDLARENCINIFAGLNGTLSGEAVTNPSEDPAPGGRIPASSTPAPSAPAPGPNAGSGTVTLDGALRAIGFARKNNLPDGVLHAAMAQALAVGANMEQIQHAGFEGQSAPSSPPQQNGFASEGPAFKLHNTDGRPNLGSYAVTALFGAERFATNLIAEQQAKDVGEGEVAAPVNLATAAAMAKVLIDIADRVQVETAGGGRADRIAQSHTRARSLVFNAIETRHPVPFGADVDTRAAWTDGIVAECVERFRHLVTLAIQPSEASAQEVTTPQQQQEALPEPQQQEQSSPQQPEPAPQQAAPQHAAPQQAQRPSPIVEGQPGFVEPDADLMAQFAGLVEAAGFQPTPDSPVVTYLTTKFGVQVVRKINAADLHTLVAWYAAKGDAAVGLFRQHVMATVEGQQQAG